MYKVLIAEDEADIRQLISFNLERESYETLLAGDGKEAVLMAYSKIQFQIPMCLEEIRSLFLLR